MLLDVDLNLLRSLHALLDAESVSEAARGLGITQAAASNALRRLREHFDDALLVRVGATMRPTPLAERLRPLAAEAMAAATRVLGEPVAFVPASAEGELCVATSDHVETVVLEPFSAHLARLAPGLRVRVEPFSSSALERLDAGDVDLVLAPRAHLGESLRVTRILEEPYAVVARQRHPALGRGAECLSLDDFTALEHVVVVPRGGSTARPLDTAVDRSLRDRDRERRVRRLVPSFSQALLLVSTSDRLATVPRSFAARFAGRLRLRVLRPPLELPPVRIDAGWSPRVHDDPLHGWCRRELVAVARREVARWQPEPA